MRPLTIQKDKSRFLLWPIRFGWKRGSSRTFFGRHGWQVGAERVPLADTSAACMPGFRDVFGQTFHVGALKIMCGPRRGEEDRICGLIRPGDAS